MDPYRAATGTCPTCGFGLRDFERRRVCDGCGGMQITRDDFLAAILDQGVLALDVRTHAETDAKCPGCAQALRRAELVVDGHAIAVEVSACTQHGIWLPGGALISVLAEIGRRAPSQRTGAAAHLMPVWANASKFGGGRLGRSAPAAQPGIHTPLASGHTGKTLACPACKAPLARSGLAWICADHGALVEEIALDSMIGEMTGAPWERPAWTGTPGARACPACSAAMAVEQLEGVEVDRCAMDGLWLDPGELETVLARSSERGRKGWLGRLFRRSR